MSKANWDMVRRKRAGSQEVFHGQRRTPKDTYKVFLSKWERVCPTCTKKILVGTKIKWYIDTKLCYHMGCKPGV